MQFKSLNAHGRHFMNARHYIIVHCSELIRFHFTQHSPDSGYIQSLLNQALRVLHTGQLPIPNSLFSTRTSRASHIVCSSVIGQLPTPNSLLSACTSRASHIVCSSVRPRRDRDMRMVDQMLSDMVVFSPRVPLLFCRLRAVRKCSTASLETNLNNVTVIHFKWL